MREALAQDWWVNSAYCLFSDGGNGNGGRHEVAVLLAAGFQPLERTERLFLLADRLAVAAGACPEVADMESMGPVLACRLGREGVLILDRNPGRRWWVEAITRHGAPDEMARRPLSSLAVPERIRSGRVFGRRRAEP